jgi:hypothetical protein
VSARPFPAVPLADLLALAIVEHGPASGSELARCVHVWKATVLAELRASPRFELLGRGRGSRWRLAAESRPQGGLGTERNRIAARARPLGRAGRFRPSGSLRAARCPDRTAARRKLARRESSDGGAGGVNGSASPAELIEAFADVLRPIVAELVDEQLAQRLAERDEGEEPAPYLTVAQYAERHHATPVAIRARIRRGALDALRPPGGREWLIPNRADKPEVSQTSRNEKALAPRKRPRA